MKAETKRICRVGAVCLGITMAIAMTAHAAYVDITVNDGSPSSNYGTDPRAGVGESGEVEANCIANASWDLRAMAFDINTNQLMIVSGFNPLTTNDNFGIGDIFVDVNNSFTVPSRPSGGNGYLTYSNSAVGYEYAIDLVSPSNGGLGYNIVGPQRGFDSEVGILCAERHQRSFDPCCERG